MKRLISHALPMRSIPGRGRVTHMPPRNESRLGSIGDAMLLRRGCRLTRASCKFRNERGNPVASRTSEKIDRLDGGKALPERVDDSAGSPARTPWSACASWPPSVRARRHARARCSRSRVPAGTRRINSSLDQVSTVSAANTLACPPAASISVFSHSKSSRADGESGST